MMCRSESEGWYPADSRRCSQVPVSIGVIFTVASQARCGPGAGRAGPGAGAAVGHGPAVAVELRSRTTGRRAGGPGRRPGRGRSRRRPRPARRSARGRRYWPSQAAAGMVRFTEPPNPAGHPPRPGWPSRAPAGHGAGGWRRGRTGAAGARGGCAGASARGGIQQESEGLAGEPGGERLGAQLVHRAFGAVGLEPAGVGGPGSCPRPARRRAAGPARRWRRSRPARSRSRPGRPSPLSCGGGSAASGS